MNNLIEYLKLHIISLEQDWDKAKNGEDIPDDEYFGADEYYQGAIDATLHILKIAQEYNNGLA